MTAATASTNGSRGVATERTQLAPRADEMRLVVRIGCIDQRHHGTPGSHAAKLGADRHAIDPHVAHHDGDFLVEGTPQCRSVTDDGRNAPTVPGPSSHAASPAPNAGVPATTTIDDEGPFATEDPSGAVSDTRGIPP